MAITLEDLRGDRRRVRRERLVRVALTAAAATSILISALIVFSLARETWTFVTEVEWATVFTSDGWFPRRGEYNILTLLVGSAIVTTVAMVIAAPVGLGSAIYLSEYARPSVRKVLKPTLEILAGIPSVVLGFFGMVVLAPFLQDHFNAPVGLNLLNASLILAVMSIPTITSLSEDAIYGVSRDMREASLALGATHWQTMWRVILPASLSGISTAVILGMSRAMGETMVVLMVAGGATRIPSSLFQPVRPLPASIAAEMAEAPFRSAHYHALFATGIVLFLFTLLFNIVAGRLSARYRQVGAATL
jgi:phosphate transport system permease protein